MSERAVVVTEDEAGRRTARAPAEDYEPGTLVELFLESVERYGNQEARLRRRRDGTWESYTHAGFAEEVRDVALGLRSLGLERGDRVGLVCETRLEWALVDFGMVMSGVVNVPVYPSLPPDQVRFILQSSGARAAFVEDQAQYDKLVEAARELPGLERAFAIEPVEPDAALEVMTVEELQKRGRGAEPGEGFESYAQRAEPGDLATLIYTSGTTGQPKGVMLTHDNFSGNVRMAARVLPLAPGDRSLCWLPLAHVFERMAGHYQMWYRGVAVAYAESVDTVARDLMEVRPTVMTAVPRLYEKFYEAATAKAQEGGALSEKIFRWARGVGEARADRVLTGKGVGPWLTLRYALADLLVFRKIRERTGGEVRYFISGGAPLSRDVARFFWAAGVPVVEGYGLTETSPVLTVNPPDDVRLGTVGPPIPGTELRIDGDGEILCRGPQVMKGYYQNEEATREAFAGDGWFRTGDVGELDSDGYLSITGRKKEILVSSYGKNIAPAPVEEAVKRSRYVEHAVLIGDQRKFPIVLVQPAFERLESWADANEIPHDDRAALVRRPEVEELMEEEVGAQVVEVADHERPRRVLVVADTFGVESGELTPTMKVKRRVIDERYGSAIDRLYEKAEREWDRQQEDARKVHSAEEL